MKTPNTSLAAAMLAAVFVFGTLPSPAANEFIGRDAGLVVWGERSNDFVIGGSFPKDRFASDEPIRLTVAIKNVGAVERKITRLFAYVDYDIVVRDSAGKEYPRRPHLILGGEGSGPGWDMLVLAADQVQSETFDLNKIYAFVPGMYVLLARRPVRAPEGDPILGTPSTPPLRFTVE